MRTVRKRRGIVKESFANSTVVRANAWENRLGVGVSLKLRDKS